MVALDWVDLTNVACEIFIGSVMCGILTMTSLQPTHALASFPGHSQILSRSRGEKLGEGLGAIYVTDRCPRDMTPPQIGAPPGPISVEIWDPGGPNTLVIWGLGGPRTPVIWGPFGVLGALCTQMKS